MEKTGTVQAVERALTLLELLAGFPQGARLTLLAKRAGLAPSTAHRLLTTLERRGFAQFDPGGARWQVGRRAFTVGIAFTRWQNFITAATPFLRRLRDLSHETANLGVLEDDEVITIAQIESHEFIRAIAMPGGRAPVMNSGMGKAIIATWPDDAVETFIHRHGLHPVTRHSLTSLSEAMTEIALIRKRGYAFDDEEFIHGMRCVAAVVRDHAGQPAGAISVSALASRLPPSAMDGMGTAVHGLARELSLTMSGRITRRAD